MVFSPPESFELSVLYTIVRNDTTATGNAIPKCSSDLIKKSRITPYTTSATVARIPGILYRSSMYAHKIKNPIKPAQIDTLRAFCPRVAPIVYSPVRTIGAGIAPVFRSLAKVVASSCEKLPVICACPPTIFSFTLGADIKFPPTKIATGFPTFRPVISSNRRDPSSSNSIVI